MAEIEEEMQMGWQVQMLQEKDRKELEPLEGNDDLGRNRHRTRPE